MPAETLSPNSYLWVDHRIYTIRLRKMKDFLDVFDRMGLPPLLATMGAPLGFHVSQVGPLNQFVHQWGYDSLEQYEACCKARDAHPGFGAYLAASIDLITAQESSLIRRVDLASLKNR